MGFSYPVDTMLDTRFVKVFDLRYAPGRHYYNATRRSLDRLPAGMESEAFERMLPDAVSCCVVLHEHGKEDRMVLNREYRYPLGRTVISVPAGLIDPEDGGGSREEAILSAAGRELYEETGLRLMERDTVTMLNPCLFSSPGLTDESNAMVRVDLYGHDVSEMNQCHADVTEKFEGFFLAGKEDALRLMKEGIVSTYTWIGLAAFLWEMR